MAVAFHRLSAGTRSARAGLPDSARILPPPQITSATTGPARAVAFTGEQLAADVDNIVATMGLRPDWPNLGVISMAHSYGFSNLVLPLLLHGIPLVLVPAPLPEMVRDRRRRNSAITLAGVPAMWRAWHEAPAIPPQCPPRHLSRRALVPGAGTRGL